MLQLSIQMITTTAPGHRPSDRRQTRLDRDALGHLWSYG